jgi:hypothetical protein
MNMEGREWWKEGKEDEKEWGNCNPHFSDQTFQLLNRMEERDKKAGGGRSISEPEGFCI